MYEMKCMNWNVRELKKLQTVKFTANRGDVIRTRDLYVPNVALYQAEPHPGIMYAVFSRHIY